MKSLVKIIPTVLFAIFIVGGLLYVKYIVPKTAFVRSTDLIYGYQGMKFAQLEYESKMKKLQHNLDTLQIEFEKERSIFQIDYSNLSTNERQVRVKKLEHLEENVNVYSQNLEKEMADEELRMTKAVLNQVNGFIETYSKQHGYDIVYGSSGNGSVLWGSKKYDITDDLLKAINENYKVNSPIQHDIAH